MSKIRILPEQLANQIAAGEVVERPASVVKELVENSLDAGADRIKIEIEGGGTRLIRIIDNGVGMDEDDVLLCLERHGTSKIQDNSDLFAIGTLGFRGEAIPSIASVSKLVITSRQADQELGTTLICHYGSVKKVHEAGAGAGTSFEVSGLFGNTPARRKFLRTVRTELSHIDDTVKNFGLARPDVSIVLQIDGRETLRLDHGMDIQRRLALLLNYSGEFIALESHGRAADNIKVTGLLVPPESSAPVAGRLRLFVNGRAVKDRMLVHGVNEGLRSFMLKGRSPAGFLKVELPPESVDINVHPAKQEIRFRDSRTVHQRVCDTVREAMLAHQQRVRREVFTPHGYSPEVPAELKSPNLSESALSSAPLTGRDEKDRYRHEISPKASPRSISRTSKSVKSQPLFETRESPPGTQSPATPGYFNDGRQDSEALQVEVEDLVVIGCFQDLYIFCRNRDKLVVIDQHAAHERLLYEELKKQYSGGKIASQSLLFPVTLELSNFHSQLVENNLDQLEDMGFAIRDFGGNTWVIGAVPALLGQGNPQDLLLDVLEQFGSDREISGGGKIDTVLATMACKAAIKSGDHLLAPEIRALLERMARADLFSHCPHGRPVIKTFNPSDIRKWFLRT